MVEKRPPGRLPMINAPDPGELARENGRPGCRRDAELLVASCDGGELAERLQLIEREQRGAR